MTRFRLDKIQAVRDLLIRLPPSLQHKVKAAFHSLAENPYQAKALKKDLGGLRSFRVAQSRIIFQGKASTVEIEAFGPRKDVYQRVATELRSARRPSRKKADS